MKRKWIGLRTGMQAVWRRHGEGCDVIPSCVSAGPVR